MTFHTSKCLGKVLLGHLLIWLFDCFLEYPTYSSPKINIIFRDY